VSDQTSEHCQAGTETTTTSSMLQRQIWEHLWAVEKEVGKEKEEKRIFFFFFKVM